jgi:hypothetical protein
MELPFEVKEIDGVTMVVWLSTGSQHKATPHECLLWEALQAERSEKVSFQNALESIAEGGGNCLTMLNGWDCSEIASKALDLALPMPPNEGPQNQPS